MRSAAANKRSERIIVDLSRKGIANAKLIGKYSYSGARPCLDSHVHDNIIEICYCDKGQQIYEVNGKKYRIGGGDVFVTYPGEPHSTANYPEEKGILFWLQIEMPREGSSFMGYAGEMASLLMKELRYLRCRHFKGTPAMKKNLEDIISLAQLPVSSINILSIHVHLQNFLLDIIRSTKEKTLHTDARIENVKKFIDDNLDSNLSIELLAGEHHISESHFKSWFKKIMGVTPMDYVHRKKIEKAKKLLRSNDSNTVTKIAYDLNFSSSQYFATVFKKYTRITPAEFRSGAKNGGSRT